MPKKKASVSIIVSLVLTALLLCAIGFLTWWLPAVVRAAIDTVDNLGNRTAITPTGRALVLVDSYAMIAVATLAVVLLLALLLTVRAGKVFTPRVPRLLLAVSLCCFGEGLLFLLLGHYFQLAVCAAIAMCFIGLCLHVVRNVLAEAILVKQENDFTI